MRHARFRGVTTEFRFIGNGVYSLTEAERLTGIPRLRIRRWMEGRSYVAKGKARYSAPIIQSSIGREVGELALTFSDLIEIRFLDRFIEKGVSWTEIRIAAERARELLSKSHPFSSRIFKTDGRSILAEIVRPGGVPVLLNLVKNQYELHRIVSPMLYADLDFNEFAEPDRWWPMGKTRRVIVDPRRSFGAPIVVDGGVPTAVLAASAKAERSQKMTALIYDVPPRAVRDAVYYETRRLA